MRRTNSMKFKMLVLYPIFLLIAALILYPLVWMTYSSFKGNADIFANVFALPTEFFLGNYITVFTEGAMGLYFRNSLLISIVSVIGLIAFSSLAAYAFATFRFRASTPLFLILLIGLMVPPQALIISGFKVMSILNLLDTYWALIFTYFGWTSFGVLVLPSLSTVAIFYFMWVWNEFIYPLVYMQSPDKYTVPLGVLFFNSRYSVEWGLQMAALAVATIVPLIVYYVFQKQFIRGILAGALKG